MRNFIRSQSSILLDVVIQKYSTFNQIQGRYATQGNIVATTNTTSEFRARFYTTANKHESSGQVSRQVSGFAEPPSQNPSYKEALQKSQAVATRKPVARAVPSVRVSKCNEHEGRSTSMSNSCVALKADNEVLAHRAILLLSSSLGNHDYQSVH